MSINTLLQASLLALLALVAASAVGGEVDTKDAIIGGGLGGAVGGAIGAEIGDRKGAIVGAAVGAAVGTAIATDDHGHGAEPAVEVVVHEEHDGHSHGHFCPPGQAKKHRC